MRVTFMTLLIALAIGGCGEVATPTATTTPTVSPSPQPTSTPTALPSPTPIPSPTPLAIAGELAFVSDRTGSFQIFLINADGTQLQQLTEGPGENAKPAWSPDGSQIAFTSDRDGNREIYIMESDGSQQTNFTDHPGEDHSPAWSPDGSAIAFVANLEGFDQLTVLDLDGSMRIGLRSRMPFPQTQFYCVTWYSDNIVSFTSIEEGVGTVMSALVTTGEIFIHRDIYDNGFSECCRVFSPVDETYLMISVESGVEQIYWWGGPEPSPVQITNHTEGSFGPSWSLDGEWVAYYTKVDGRYDVFLIQPENLEPVNLTNNPANDLEPAWRPMP